MEGREVGREKGGGNGEWRMESRELGRKCVYGRAVCPLGKEKQKKGKRKRMEREKEKEKKRKDNS